MFLKKLLLEIHLFANKEIVEDYRLPAASMAGARGHFAAMPLTKQ